MLVAVRTGSRWRLGVCLAVCGLGLLLVVGLVAILPPEQAPGQDTPQPLQQDKEAIKPLETGKRRLPVAGAPDYALVIDEDGSSYLEGPGQQRVRLASKGELTAILPEQAVRVIEARLPKRPVPLQHEIGQLVVLAEGVVDVPKDAIITLIDSDHLVVWRPQGSLAYYADGRVEERGSAKESKKERP